MFLVLYWNPSLKSSHWRTYHSLLRSTLHLIRIHIVEINLDKHTLKAHFLELTVLLLSEVSSSSCEFSSSSSFSSMLCPLQSSEDPWLPWVGWLDFNRKWACPHCQARERFSMYQPQNYWSRWWNQPTSCQQSSSSFQHLPYLSPAGDFHIIITVSNNCCHFGSW